MNLRRLRLPFVWCVAGALPLALIDCAQGQGSIQFLNSALSRFQYRECQFPTGPSTLVNAPAGAIVRVEVSDSPHGSFNSVGVPVTSMTGGLINGGVVYPIPGTFEGQTVWMRVTASYNNGLFARTEVLPITLGPTAGPGTVIFQTALGTATNRFRPLLLQPAGLCRGDALISAMRAREIVPTHPSADVSAVFKISCTKDAATIEATISYQTVDGTALAGRDYEAASGTLLFDELAPFLDPEVIDLNVRVFPRPIPTGSKYFFLQLSNSSPTPSPPSMVLQWISDPFVASIRRQANASVITTPTVTGWNYTLESTVDLIDWLPVPGAIINTADGVTSFQDPQPDCCGHRFYRLRAQ